ncbi:MAG: hypothetical protein CYPHOPRED_001429 [Cyphobasidiales sp. Tagirdzhanova-0007]|nr:MAG: hypothetical protein CYPHOPRED_001429 [Cyphobasidiales sp. Tagirdzhanova-0007]
MSDTTSLYSICLSCKRLSSHAQERLLRHCALDRGNNSFAIPHGVIWRHDTLEHLAFALTQGVASKSITSLHLHWSSAQADIHLIPNLIRHTPKIRYLTLDLYESAWHPQDSFSPELPVSSMHTAFEQLERLSHLYLRFTSVAHVDFYFYRFSAMRLDDLQCLRLEGLVDLHINATTRPKPFLPKLELLDLENFNLRPGELHHLLESFLAFSCLQELRICAGLVRDVLYELPSSLHESLQALILDVGQCDFPIDLKPLQHFRNLSRMDLWASVSSDDLSWLPSSLLELNFYLDRQQIELIAMRLLDIEFLPNLRQLQLLFFEWEGSYRDVSQRSLLMRDGSKHVYDLARVAMSRQIKVEPAELLPTQQELSSQLCTLTLSEIQREIH